MPGKLHPVWKERGGETEKKGRGRNERKRKRKEEGEASRRHREENPVVGLPFPSIVEDSSQEIWEGFKDTAALGGSRKMLSIATC